MFAGTHSGARRAIATAFLVFGLQAVIEVLDINGPSWIPMAFAFYALGSYAVGPARLKALGVRLALVTNGAAEPQRAKVIRFALEERFDHIQIEGEHGFGKPEERAYTHAMEALGVGPQETWMVGDNLEWEIAAPQRLGIYAIWYDGYDGMGYDCMDEHDAPGCLAL